MLKQIYLLQLALLFCLFFAQTKDEIRVLTSGQPVERVIAGGASHTYQISPTARQFVRVVVEQRGEHLAGNSGDKSGVTTFRLIPRLPFTRQEATRLLALTLKSSSFGATDFQASRATALDPALGQYGYLHFATHGYLDSERPGTNVSF